MPVIEGGVKMDMTVVTGALASLRAATEIAKGLVGANTAVEVNKTAIELQGALLNAYGDAVVAQEALTALKDEIRELKRKLADNEDFAADLKRYAMFSPWTGSTVYAVKESMCLGEPPHYICANCAQQKKKSILATITGANGFGLCTCANCKTQFTTSFRGAASAKYPPET